MARSKKAAKAKGGDRTKGPVMADAVMGRAKAIAEAGRALRSAAEAHSIASKTYRKAIADLVLEVDGGPTIWDAAAEAVGVDDEAWRSESIRALGLTAHVTCGLEEEGFRSLGDLNDFMKTDRHTWEDLPGIGAKGAERIADGWEAYFKAHPRADKSEGFLADGEVT